jgi:hypothetical protein
MANDYIPDPFKNFTPRQNPKTVAKVEETQASEDFTEEIARLENMPVDELRGVLQRICNARWGDIALMSKQQRAEAGRLKLWHAGLTEKEVYKALPILKEAFDRDEGRASQNVNMNVESTSLSKLSDDRLLRLERELSRVTGQEAMVILPMPEKLES